MTKTQIFCACLGLPFLVVTLILVAFTLSQDGVVASIKRRPFVAFVMFIVSSASLAVWLAGHIIEGVAMILESIAKQIKAAGDFIGHNILDPIAVRFHRK